ncbi:uncharacterized protein LOC114316188 [Camellia sinensis]|uniref:Uncharacterized protein n=1 Tax=Camellia sinensis var. sinensis TaxID=542762 RepID=A0A4S4D3B5_CAMSN|nr:uncharacterized protein LOC114316188 [Camellia sinensis]THF96800.1 hypothetical protein TEA_025744 [Camellia sinensis var. sinensis]
MIHLICKRLQHTIPLSSTTLHAYFFSTSSLKPTSDFLNSTDPQSLTVSYLSKSCGLSLESAISASKKVQFETTDQPDSVLNLLKSNGLSKIHIRNMITNRPLILLADPIKTLKPNIDLLGSLGFKGSSFVELLNKEPRVLESDADAVVEFFRAYEFTEKQIYMLTMKRPVLYIYNATKIFKPKLEYFKSLGFSGADIAQILSSEPYILERSLQNKIMPSIEVIRRVVGSDENVLKAIKASYRILEYDLEKVFEPNIANLINRGVPESKILKLILIQPKSLLLRGNRFSEVVDEVEKLGFDPKNLLFVLAVRSLAVMSKSLWEQKLGLYCSFGLSKDEIISAFKLQPMCMIASEKKIKKLMGFFVNELKLKPSMISKNPNILLLSLEKRIIPRCSVLQLLMSKDAIKKDVSLLYALTMTEKMFVKRYVSKYMNVIPEVVEALQGKIQFQGFPIELKTNN